MIKRVCTLYALLGIVSAVLATAPITAIERKVKRRTIPNVSTKDNPELQALYPSYNLSVPIDHFHNDSRYEPHTDEDFHLRYWFDATYYKVGGPVIVLQSGETSGIGRLPFLQKGLLHDLAVATNGIGVVLEHRYYGTSIPTPDLSTANLRFLTTDQALADQAYFARNVVFAGFEHMNLTSPNVAYIGYGGSYAGAFVAFLRKLYPDIFWGTISSSGVVEAIYDYWAYYEPIRVYADQKCVSYVQKVTHVVDNILFANESSTKNKLKTVFGLPNVTYDADFAQTISHALASWQTQNWDPAIDDPNFNYFCGNITAGSVVDPENVSREDTVKDLLTKGDYAAEIDTLTIPMLNWIGWINRQVVSDCTSGSQDSCFGTNNITFYEQDDITQVWRSWPYQYCTQWGYLQTGAGVPAGQLPLISRTITLEWESLICVHAFNITTPPNVTAINHHGGFGLSYPRLAMIDGEIDPWRPATAHASPFNTTAVNRTDTVSEPFVLIPGGVHHWDENGLLPNESSDSLPPAAISDVQAQEISLVLAWMQEWHESTKQHPTGELKSR